MLPNSTLCCSPLRDLPSRSFSLGNSLTKERFFLLFFSIRNNVEVVFYWYISSLAYRIMGARSHSRITWRINFGNLSCQQQPTPHTHIHNGNYVFLRSIATFSLDMGCITFGQSLWYFWFFFSPKSTPTRVGFVLFALSLLNSEAWKGQHTQKKHRKTGEVFFQTTLRHLTLSRELMRAESRICGCGSLTVERRPFRRRRPRLHAICVYSS